MSLTLTETGKVLTETQDGITMPADYSFDTVNGYVHGIDVDFEDLVGLCLGMANHIDKLKHSIEVQNTAPTIDCRTCTSYAGNSCQSAIKCTNGDMYLGNILIQCWTKIV